MKLNEVKSSNIKSVGWENNTLYVQYNNGLTYSYAEVNEETYNNLMNAESKGRFINSEIKGKHAFTRLPEMKGE